MVLSIVGSILEFSHRRAEFQEKYHPKCVKLCNKFLKVDEVKLEKHYFYLSHLYKSIFSVMVRANKVEPSEALMALKISIMYFVYSKTLDQSLLLLAKYTAQPGGGADLLKEEDLYVLVIKIFEGYSYNPNTLQTAYIMCCNLATNDAFVEKASKLKVFFYALIHAQNNWKSPELVGIIFRFLKYMIRNGHLGELFYEAVLELKASMDYSLGSLVVKVGRDIPTSVAAAAGNEVLQPQPNTIGTSQKPVGQQASLQAGASNGPVHITNWAALTEMLTVIGLAARNNRKLEVSLLVEKEFVAFIRILATEYEPELTEEMLDALAGLPLEDILLT